MHKPRILMNNEASFLATGFSIYGKEVFSRLHQTGKFELAELACYGHQNDPRSHDIPWKYYGNLPDRNNEQEMQAYNAKTENQFGAFRFEQVCLDFKPDHVIDYRDFWMLAFEQHSPFRPFYYWTIMPTVDSAPQDEQWIAAFMNANAVFTYTDWALNVLNKQSGGKINTIGTASPCADSQAFKPVALEVKEQYKQDIGISKNAFIVGTVMRNQKRKLYPDLIESFAEFLKRAPADISQKTYLYLHTSHPDIGWDIPRLIKESGIARRIIVTYVCHKCNTIYASTYQDALAVCKKCGHKEARMPGTQTGIPHHVLARIMNTFDVYVQYAIAEGMGMPQVEAASCGIPVFATDYSAMEDVVRKINGVPIKVIRKYRESETHCWRALPDNNDFIDKLIKFFQLPTETRQKQGLAARQGMEKHYSWDKTAKTWETHFDSILLRPIEETWHSPPRIFHPQTTLPQQLSNEQAIRWGILNVLGLPEMANSYLELRLLRDVNQGVTIDFLGGLAFNDMSNLGMKPRYRKFDLNQALNELSKIRKNINQWERVRASIIKK